MDKEKNNLKKLIRYRLSYSGMKETDIIYQRMILKKIEFLNMEDLKLLSNLFNEISDSEIFNMLTNKKKIIMKYRNLFSKILDE